jgi:hypothetical protein
VTPEQISSTTHEARIDRLKDLRDDVRQLLTGDKEIPNAMADEALLIVLESIRYAQKSPPPPLPSRPIDYLEAILCDPSPGMFMESLKPRVVEWVAWCREFEDKGVSPRRKEQLRILLRKVGLISKRRRN